jgi:hypothetical protein
LNTIKKLKNINRYVHFIYKHHYKMNLKLCEDTVINDVVIIHRQVNKLIGILDEKFKKLIFSNYNDINISIQLNNEYNNNTNII